MDSFKAVAAKEDVGTRLDVFCAGKIAATRSHIRKMIENAEITLNGKTSKCGCALKAGDVVEAVIAPLKKLSLEPENLPVDIIFEDADIAVVNKPRGMVVHPAAGAYSGTLVNALLARLDSLSGINGVARPGIVHRLDKDTSGLLVVAKNDAAHVELQRQIASKEAKRYYIALVSGVIKAESGVIDAPLARSDRDRKKIAVKQGGRSAVTHFEVLKRYKNFTLCRFELKTGRTHQIRVHCKHIGHTISGDVFYGDKDYFGAGGQLLHAYKLVIKHPTTDEIMEFTAPLPPVFKEVIDKLENRF